MDAVFARFEQAVRDAQMVALATIVSGPGQGQRLLVWPDGTSLGTLGNPGLDSLTVSHAGRLMREQRSDSVSIEAEGQPGLIFIDVQPPPPKLIVVGAVHIAIPLVTFANVLGFHTIVIDARSAFATAERFGHASRVIARWPADVLPELGVDEATYFVMLTHDAKIDDPALVYACRSPARYIGALGSRRTHAERVRRLLELGLAEQEIARIHAPIGLNIGARRPEEIAVAIIGEIVAVANNAA